MSLSYLMDPEAGRLNPALADFAELALLLGSATAVRIETPEGFGEAGIGFRGRTDEIPFGEEGRLSFYGAQVDGTFAEPLIRLLATYQRTLRETMTVSTDIARANDIARSASYRFEALFEGLPIACYACDTQGRLVEWNAAAEEIWGVGLAMAWGKDAAPIIDPHDPDAERSLLTRALGGETVRDEERELILAPGETRCHLAYAFPLRDEGETIGTIGVRLDITRRREAQRALAEREALYRTVLETLAEGLILVDDKGQVVLRNASADRILKIETAEIDLFRAFPPEAVIDADGRFQAPEQWPLSIALRTGQPARDVLQGILRPDVEERLWIRVNAEPILRNGSPDPVGAVAIFREVEPPG